MLCPRCNQEEMDVEYLGLGENKDTLVKKQECPACHSRTWERIDFAEQAFRPVVAHLTCEVCHERCNELYITPNGFGCENCRGMSDEIQAMNQNFRHLLGE